MKIRRVKIHREGVNILLILFGILGVVNAAAWLFMRPLVLPVIFSSISAIVYLMVLNFFRSPRRQCPLADDPRAVISSVDGTVVAVEEVTENEYLHARTLQVSVFMTIFNVHANWFPINGIVRAVRHYKGRFYSAYLPKASIENEHSSVLIEAENGQNIVVSQVAGAIARRIVTYAEPGDECSVEEHMGFIKFGSRVDIYLPLDSKILVKVGDKTTGGVSQIARLAD